MKHLTVLILFFLMAVIIHSNSYSTSEAKILAYMSYISYDSLESINHWSCDKCSKYPLKNVKADGVSTADLQWFSGYSDQLNGIVLAFRGSKSIQNWIVNLSANLTSYPKCSGCQVHLGFYCLATCLQPCPQHNQRIKKKVKKVAKKQVFALRREKN